MARRIETLDLAGPAGRLEALLEEPEPSPPRGAAVVCHPHPLHGGTMRNKVVHRLARGLRTAGLATLRFNFRGVGHSEGSHGGGVGEVDDARAALAELRRRYPDLPLVAAGFSFGSRVAAALGPEVRLVLLAGYPARWHDDGAVERCPVARVFVQSTHDEYGPRTDLGALAGRLWGPVELDFVEAADHFFNGGLAEFESRVAARAQSWSSRMNQKM
jgi:uncharacterized protein